MIHTSHIRIDLDAIAGNVRSIQAAVNTKTAICPVVKADAYGLGADRVARTLVSAGVNRLAVFTLQQAIQLESRASHAKILVLMPVQEIPNDPAIARLIASGRLELVVSTRAQAIRLAATRFGRALPIHLEVDCGMGRAGASIDDVPALIEEIVHRRSLQLVGIFTHFSSSLPEQVREEAARFDAVLAKSDRLLPTRVIRHAASTGSCFSEPSQQRDMVRIGLGWTGWLPAKAVRYVPSETLQLRPAVTWCSQLFQVRELPAGATVGYGSTWRAAKPTTVGLVPVGYSHGYPVGLVDPADPQRVLVAVGDSYRAVPVIGAVNMDQLVIDLSKLEGFEPQRDRQVILLSDQADSAAGLHALSRRAGIQPHALLCGLGASIPRVYLANGTSSSGGNADAAHVVEPSPGTSSMAAG